MTRSTPPAMQAPAAPVRVSVSAAAAAPASAPAAPPVPPARKLAAAPEKTKPKAKLVRDSFTMPHAEFEQIATLKARALAFGRPVKKSELLRAGLHALVAMKDAALRKAIDQLVPLKPGRPKQ